MGRGWFFTVSSPLVPVIWKPFYSTFKILSCTNSKKNGKAGDSKADRSSSKLHKSHKNGPNSPKFPSKDVSIICLSLLFLWSFRFHHNCQRSRQLLILNFFIRVFFLGMRMTGHLTVAQSLRHSNNLLASGRRHSVSRVS